MKEQKNELRKLKKDKKKKDILFICQYFYPEYVSSATLPFDTAKALVQEGYNVSTLCGYPYEYYNGDSVPLNELHEGINIKRLKYLSFKRTNFLGRLINYFSFTFSVLLRFFSLKNFETLIVYSNPPILPLIAAWASKIFRIKFIFVCYDVYPEMASLTNSISENGLIYKIMLFVNKRVFHNAAKVVVLSNEMKEYLLKNREISDSTKVVVIPNWYEYEPVKELVKSHLNELFLDLEPKNNFIVSYLGNIGISQDLDTILDAIRFLRNENSIKFIFAGHGNKIGLLKKTVCEEHLDKVTIYDFLHNDDYEDALNISDLFIVSLAKGLTGLAVPSRTYSFMAAGKPILTLMDSISDISKDLMNNNAGFAIDIGDPSSLAKAILKLKSDEKLKLKMGINSRRIYEEKYTISKGVAKYVSMMNEMFSKTH